jgi:hypothetical protein
MLRATGCRLEESPGFLRIVLIRDRFDRTLPNPFFSLGAFPAPSPNGWLADELIPTIAFEPVTQSSDKGADFGQEKWLS